MLEQLQTALSQAFTPQTLERMVRFKLDKDINDYASVQANKQEAIFRLIDAAKREGFLNQLVLGARAFNPGNGELYEFCRALGLASTSKSAQSLERIIDDTKPNLNPVQLRQKIFEAEMRVCRVEVAIPGGTVYGTGFLIADDKIMTNHHVMDRVISKQVSPSDVRLRFDFKRVQSGVVDVGNVCGLATSWLVDASLPGDLDEPSAEELDYAIVQLASAPPRLNDTSRGHYQIQDQALLVDGGSLFIMQHPSARAVELAMDTNGVLGHNSAKTRVRYRTNTEGGSSGSPCFTQNFELVALHHSGDPNFDAAHKPAYNQGIPIGMIARLLKARGKAAQLGMA